MSVLSIAAYVMSGLLIVIVNKCLETRRLGELGELGASGATCFGAYPLVSSNGLAGNVLFNRFSRNLSMEVSN